MWTEIQSPPGYERPAFQRDQYVTAAKFNGTSRVWEIFRRHEDGTLKTLNGIWVQSFDSAGLSHDSVSSALGQVDRMIAEGEARGR